MDTLTANPDSQTDLLPLRKAIDVYLRQWETAFPNARDFRILTVRDAEKDQYLVLQEAWQNDLYEDAILIHLTIRNGKIWILQNNTSDEVGKILIEHGIPRDKIVVGFLPLRVRADSDYAIE